MSGAPKLYYRFLSPRMKNSKPNEWKRAAIPLMSKMIHTDGSRKPISRSHTPKDKKTDRKHSDGIEVQRGRFLRSTNLPSDLLLKGKTHFDANLSTFRSQQNSSAHPWHRKRRSASHRTLSIKSALAERSLHSLREESVFSPTLNESFR